MLNLNLANAQPGRGGRGGPPTANSLAGEAISPVEPGESGIAWYCNWEVAEEEARRSNRPIMFLAAASQCNGVPGVF